MRPPLLAQLSIHEHPPQHHRNDLQKHEPLQLATFLPCHPDLDVTLCPQRGGPVERLMWHPRQKAPTGAPHANSWFSPDTCSGQSANGVEKQHELKDRQKLRRGTRGCSANLWTYASSGVQFAGRVGELPPLPCVDQPFISAKGNPHESCQCKHCSVPC